MSSASEELDAELANIESYETEDGTVLYDARNPLAWIKADDIVVLEDNL